MYPGRIRWADVVDRAAEVIASYDHEVSLRQVYYRLVAARVIPHTASAYRRLSAHLAAARRAGRCPELVDALRVVHLPPVYRDPAQLLAAVPAAYRRDRTAGQRLALYVTAEKDTLRVLLTAWLEEYGIPVLVVRGFASQSYADLVRARVAADPRPAVLLYVGDLDASGEDIERDWIARTGCWSGVARVALTSAQVREHQLPPTLGKAGDPRWTAFADRHGLDPGTPVQWEVEALDPAELHRLVVDAVQARTDTAVLARVVEEERQQAQTLREFLSTWSEPR